MESCSFSNPKRVVCECSGNNIKLRHVQAYGLGINRNELKSATKWILFFAVQVNKCNISRFNFSFFCYEQLIITEFVIAFSQSKKQSFLGGAAILNKRSIFTQASVQLHFLCFCFHSVFRFFFLCFCFCFGFLHHCNCKTTPLQEDIITLTSGVTSHYIVSHPVNSRASRTSGLCVQFIHHSWLVDYRNI